jgi:hypothetical protein
MRSVLMSLVAFSLIGFCAFQSIPFPGPGGGSHNSGLPLTNLVLWYEADCITYSGGNCSTPSDGTTISAWSDKSGNGNDLSLDSGTCTFHTSQVNGQPAVTFSSCHWSIANSIASVADHHIYVVLQLDSGANSMLLGGDGGGFGSGSCGFWYGKHSGKYQGIDKVDIAELGYGAATRDTTWHQVNTRFKNDDTLLAFRMDRADDAATSESTAGCNLPITQVGYNFATNSENFAGKLAALLYYQSNSGSVRDTTDRDAVETYLHNKYGL